MKKNPKKKEEEKAMRTSLCVNFSLLTINKMIDDSNQQTRKNCEENERSAYANPRNACVQLCVPSVALHIGVETIDGFDCCDKSDTVANKTVVE